MLAIQIDNDELEEVVKSKYGDNLEPLAADFMTFLKATRIQEDIEISQRELTDGKGVKMSEVMEELRSKYE